MVRANGFDPGVFKRRIGKSKGVDIALVTYFLIHAVDDNYDWVVLVAGDQDYLPLVSEVKRRGKVVVVAFFEEEGIGEQLKVEADHFFAIDSMIRDEWLRYGTPVVGTSGLGGGVSIEFRGTRLTDAEGPSAPDKIIFTKGGSSHSAPLPERLGPNSEQIDLRRFYDQLIRKADALERA